MHEEIVGQDELQQNDLQKDLLESQDENVEEIAEEETA
jgi:hypothetical protein